MIARNPVTPTPASRLPVTTLSAIARYVTTARDLGHGECAINDAVRGFSRQHIDNDAAFIVALRKAERELCSVLS